MSTQQPGPAPATCASAVRSPSSRCAMKVVAGVCARHKRPEILQLIQLRQPRLARLLQGADGNFLQPLQLQLAALGAGAAQEADALHAHFHGLFHEPLHAVEVFGGRHGYVGEVGAGRHGFVLR